MVSSKLVLIWRGWSQKLYNNAITIILVMLLCTGLGIGLTGSYQLSLDLVDAQAQQYAEVVVKTLNETNRHYSHTVVRKLETVEGVTISPNYQNIEGGIPIPTTYTIDLSERLSDKSKGILFSIYSDYPFPERAKTGGPQDAFQVEALSYLQKHPTETFNRKDKVGSHLAFRHAQPIRMEASCVACHNTMPSSPKKDWKIGDVRGVIEVTQPLDSILLIAQDGLQNIYGALITTTVLAIGGLILVLRQFRKINLDLEKQVAQRTQALHRLANLDGLTQLANRRQFDEVLTTEWRRLQRRQYPLSLLLCDVDYFKGYNDTYGHQEGDRCLIAISRVLERSRKRAGELVARYGGEEFVIVLPYTGCHSATNVAQLIQTSLHELKMPHETSQVSPFVTLSIGIATMIPSPNNHCEQLIKRADAALYQAKKQGRSRYVVWQDNESE